MRSGIDGTVGVMQPDQSWQDSERWWLDMAQRLGVAEQVQLFFQNALGQNGSLARVHGIGGDVDYILFVLLRYWVPPVLPPAGRERTSKHDQDYWLESEHILKSAVTRLRELKPLIELLTAPNPFAPPEQAPPPAVAEVDLARMLEGIAEVAGSYGGPDYTSVIKPFVPIPLRQTQPFKHNKKNSAELWMIFLLREHLRALGLGKDRYWPLIADIAVEAGIRPAGDAIYSPDELKAWWQKNWPRTYTQLEQKAASTEPSGAAYRHDFEWFREWYAWQTSRPSTGN